MTDNNIASAKQGSLKVGMEFGRIASGLEAKYHREPLKVEGQQLRKFDSERWSARDKKLGTHR